MFLKLQFDHVLAAESLCRLSFFINSSVLHKCLTDGVLELL